MAVTDEHFKAYLRLPPDSTEDVSGYLAAAKSKARAAGVPDYDNNAQYDMFLLSLAGMYYDNRGMTYSGTYQATARENADRLINSFVLSLRGAGEDAGAETGVNPDE